MNRTKEVIETNLREEQAGFRPKRLRVNHIFALKINTGENVQEQKPNATNVKDFKKYFHHYLDCLDYACLESAH